MVQNMFLQEYCKNYLVFISVKKYIRFFSGSNKVYLWKSNEIPKESIENITTTDRNFTPTLNSYYPLPGIKFNGNCLINNNILFSKKVRNFIQTRSII